MIQSKIWNDAAMPWQLNFQDSASPIHEGIVELHDSIMFYLIVIGVLVFWVLTSVFSTFGPNKITNTHSSHGTVIELLWTISPALVLLAIAFPSFRLLYLMDINPSLYTGDFTDYVLCSILPILAKKIPIKKIYSSSTELVVYKSINSLGSTVGINLNKQIRNNTYLNPIIRSQIIGHLLGDGSLWMTWSSITPYFVMTQTVKRFDYIWDIFIKLSPYCSRYPSLALSKKTYFFMQVSTRSYPFLNSLHSLFYKKIKGNNKYKKIISPELIFYLDDIALAYWAMDDGANAIYGFHLHTKSFSLKEVSCLAGILHYNFNLNCVIQDHVGYPVIYIGAKEYPKFVKIVKPHFHPSFLYKLK